MNPSAAVIPTTPQAKTSNYLDAAFCEEMLGGGPQGAITLIVEHCKKTPMHPDYTKRVETVLSKNGRDCKWVLEEFKAGRTGPPSGTKSSTTEVSQKNAATKKPSKL